MSELDELMVKCDFCGKEYLGDPQYLTQHRDDKKTRKCYCRDCFNLLIINHKVNLIQYRTEPPSFSSFGEVMVRFFESENEFNDWFFTKEYWKDFINYERYQLLGTGQLVLRKPNTSDYIFTGAFFPKNIYSPCPDGIQEDFDEIKETYYFYNPNNDMREIAKGSFVQMPFKKESNTFQFYDKKNNVVTGIIDRFSAQTIQEDMTLNKTLFTDLMDSNDTDVLVYKIIYS